MANILPFVILLFSLNIFSEEIISTKRQPVWLDLSLGSMLSSDIGGLNFSAALLTDYNSYITGVEYRYTQNYFLSGDGTTTEYNLLIGRSFGNNYVRILLVSGAGLIHLQTEYSTYYDYYSDVKLLPNGARERFEIGIPILISFQVTALKYVGLGASFRANFNPISNMAGLSLNLLLGSLRK